MNFPQVERFAASGCWEVSLRLPWIPHGPTDFECWDRATFLFADLFAALEGKILTGRRVVEDPMTVILDAV